MANMVRSSGRQHIVYAETETIATNTVLDITALQEALPKFLDRELSMSNQLTWNHRVPTSTVDATLSLIGVQIGSQVEIGFV